MTEKKKRPQHKGYSLKEIKDKYLPNRDMASLEQQETPLARETFVEMLRRVSRLQKADHGKSDETE